SDRRAQGARHRSEGARATTGLAKLRSPRARTPMAAEGPMLKQAIVIVMLAAGTARAQTPEPTPTPATGDAYAKGTLGLVFPLTILSNLGGAKVLGETPPTIDILYFTDDKTAFDLIVGVNLHKEQIVSGAPPMATDTTVFGFTIGAGYRMYKHKDKLHTFIEPQVVLEVPDTSDVGQFLSLQINGLFGVERSIADWVSVGGAIGGGLAA